MSETTNGDTRLRDLDEEAFRRRYGCDRFSATVISNRFRYIVEHLCADLLHNAFSPVLREWYDFATTICGPPEVGYPTPAVSNSLVVFIGTMTDAVQNLVEEYGIDRLREGDVLIGNDPYRYGTHVNDVVFVRPVFEDGALIGFVNFKAHQLDMGGAVPGGFSGTKRNVFENGLSLSPRPLMQAGEPVRETWSLLLENIRFADLVALDMQTICRGLELGDRLLRESAQRYGLDAVLGAMRYATDAGAERMADAIENLPDGEWTGEALLDCDGVDDEEEYLVKARIVKRGRRVEVDLSGSSRQARTSVNGTVLDAKTAVAVAFKYLFDPHGTFTSGAIRAIDVVLPEGTIVSALPPNGVVFLFWDATNLIVAAILQALAEPLGRDAVAGDMGTTNLHNASGFYADGTQWVSAIECGGEHGPWGATHAGDGDSYTFHFQLNNLDPALESIESTSPVIITRREYVADTSGPGENRGGAAVLKDSYWLQPAEHHSMALRWKRPSGFGVQGGREGMNGGVWVWDPPAAPGLKVMDVDPASYHDAIPVSGWLDPETHELSRDTGQYEFFADPPVHHTEVGASFRYVTNAGGGWGDPLDRAPERVRDDVRDGYVTIAGAARDYGVVVTGEPDEYPEDVGVDVEATTALRAAKRAERA